MMGTSMGFGNGPDVGQSGNPNAVNRIGLGGAEDVINPSNGVYGSIGPSVGQNAQMNAQAVGRTTDAMSQQQRQKLAQGLSAVGASISRLGPPQQKGGGGGIPITPPQPPQLPSLDYSLGLGQRRQQQQPFFGSY